MNWKKISAKLKFTNKFGAAIRTRLKSSFTGKEPCINSCTSAFLDFWLFWKHFIKFSILSSHFYHVWHTYLLFCFSNNWDFSWIRLRSFSAYGMALFIDLFIDYMIIFSSFPRDENFSSLCSCSSRFNVMKFLPIIATLFSHCFHLLCATKSQSFKVLKFQPGLKIAL